MSSGMKTIEFVFSKSRNLTYLTNHGVCIVNRVLLILLQRTFRAAQLEDAQPLVCPAGAVVLGISRAKGAGNVNKSNVQLDVLNIPCIHSADGILISDKHTPRNFFEPCTGLKPGNGQG